jgi:hypothetical protein
VMYAATGFASAVEQQSVQNGTGINDDGMLQCQRSARVFRADDFDFLNELFGQRIIEQKRKALRGFVRQATATGLFPGEVLIENVHGVAGASELLAAHGARRAPTDNDIVCHLVTKSSFVAISVQEGWM